jgi:hypothetical protein
VLCEGSEYVGVEKRLKIGRRRADGLHDLGW